MRRQVWLEAALNGPWGRAGQPLIPIAADEIVAQGIACAEEGAAVIHVHPYHVETGRQREDADVYARIIEGIRQRVDAIVYPTLPLAGSPDASDPMSPEERFAVVEELCRRGLIEWSVVDPGSCNLSLHRDVAEGRPGFVYANPDTHIRHGLALAERYGFSPSYAIYEPGFVRLGASLAKEFPRTGRPIYRLMLSEQFTFGFPPRRYALDAYRTLLDEAAPDAPWMIAGLGVDLRGLIPEAVAMGAHVRVGLEDAPLGTETANVEWVRQAARLIEAAGGSLATPGEVRAASRSPM